jgi:processive 1,2-diacylglycerol beta-glucosyltransferase
MLAALRPTPATPLEPVAYDSAATGDPVVRVSVLWVPLGGGHRSVADAVAHDVSAAANWAARIEALDILAATSRWLSLDRAAAALCFTLSQPYLRWIYALLFRLADAAPAAVSQLAYVLFRRRALQWLQRSEPDIVVSTYPFVSYVVAKAARRAGLRVSVISVVTDAGRVNAAWFAGPVDLFAVTDDEALEAARANGVSPGRAVQVVLPLRPQFRMAAHSAGDTQRAPSMSRRASVLVWGGGQGQATRILALAKRFCDQAITADIVVVTGTNRRLAERLRGLAWPGDALILEDCVHVAPLLAKADLVIGKAGWLSLAEADAAGTHTMCIDALPGQEQENLRVAIAAGAATWQPDVDRLVGLICDLPCRDLDRPRARTIGNRGRRLEDVIGELATPGARKP